MNGGKITNNTVQSEFAGAGVRSYGADSTIIINRGEISGNHGFGVEAWRRFEINGGKIINNDKGGVMVTKMPYISGSPVIKDNYHDGKPFNLSLGSNKLHISGHLGSDFEIGIASCDSSYIFTDNWNETMGDADPADYFTSDSDITKVKRYSDEGALCVLLTLDTSGWTGIVGDIPDPTYHPRFKEVELPMDLKLKGHIFGGWSEMKNRPQGSSSIELKGDTTVYPAFEVCKYHSKLRIYQVDPTCTKDGFEEYVLCEKCGLTFSPSAWSEIFEPKAIPALKHDFGDWTTVEEATCTADGIKERVCKRSKCGQKETDIIPQTGHDFGADWEKNEAQHWHECTVCHDKNDIAEHTFFEGKCTVCQKVDPNYSKPTDTEPTVTEPPVTEPSDTEPTVTEPPVTDPSGTEPTVTEPPVTEPTVTAPPVTEPPITEPIVTNPPYIPYFPPNNATAPTISASREPFLQNENGKIGWEVISDNIWETSDGETVLVNMNGTNELPKNIVSDISGRDIDLVLIMNDGFVWTINGSSVTKAKTINMGVRKISKIPNSTVQKFFGDVKTVQIDLRHNGDFGFVAELTLDIGNRYDRMYTNSYCYKSRKFEFGNSAEISDGQAKLRFAHASSWLITIENSPVLENVSTGAAAHSTSTPIDMSNFAGRGITVPDFDFERKLRLSNKKRRYRILKKRRLDDLVFVL